MLIVELRGASIPVREPDACENVWYGGYANRISAQRTAYPQIEGIHAADEGAGPTEPAKIGNASK